MLKKLAKQLKSNYIEKDCFPMTSPFQKQPDRDTFLKRMSKHALNLYEKQTDINNFKKLVLSDPENDSHNQIMNELFEKGVKDVLEEQTLFELSENSRFLEDLGIE